MRPPLTLSIDRTWDGRPVADGAAVQLADGGDALLLRILAPWHRDPPPTAAPGPTPRLWEHEVVEWFCAGPGDAYLEVELGPHGHHLVLVLEGVRHAVREGLPLDGITTRSDAGWWTATVGVPRAWLPPEPHRVNAYRIHGEAPHRRYLAHAAVPGDAPDFHRLHAFVPATPADAGPPDDVALLAAALGVDGARAAGALAATDRGDEGLLAAAAALGGAAAGR